MRTNAANLGLLVLALGASIWGAASIGDAAPRRAASRALADAPPAGVSEIVDARGVSVPVRSYRRIVSLNTISDHLLLDLVEPERLIAITQYTAEGHPDAWRFGARPAVGRSDQIEEVISLRPDLVVVSRFAEETFMERLREAGITVFDLGEMLGVATTRANIRALGVLLDERERSERAERRLARELAELEAAIPPGERVPGIYLSVYGDHFSGGTKGTSYADVLHYAGVRDLAAEHGFEGWPRYTPEQLLALDPPLIVTHPGRAAAICDHSLLQGLRACGEGGRIVEVAESWLDDPGLGVIEAARSIQEALRPERAAGGPGR